MNKKGFKFLILIFIGVLIFPAAARAVIPPDFIFNIGSQIIQFFSIAVIFLSTALSVLYQFFKFRFDAIRHKKFALASVAFLIIGISLAASYFYADYKQKNEYAKWLEESAKQNQNINPDQKENNAGNDDNDKLKIGNDKNKDVDISLEKFVSNIGGNSDNYSKFIEDYYKNIANGNYQEAYEMSTKTFGYETFRSWYINTTKITLDKLVRIDDKKSSLELTLYEGKDFTRYGVLMTLYLENSVPLRAEKSEVKILSQGYISGNEIVDESKDKFSEEYKFFEANKNTNIIITNEKFKSITESGRSDYIVLDARENIEYENGYYPGSIHIRFADIKAGRWIELPRDKFIFVICWSGIRGKEVAELLRTKNLVASYLETGASGWVDFGGKWVGNIKFADKYSDERFQLVFTTVDVKQKVSEGIRLVDSREPFKFRSSHISGSVNIPIMYTPTIDMEKVFGQIPPGSKVITICDGYVNCFDAKITGAELEKRGSQFLGRYNKPWEYGK